MKQVWIELGLQSTSDNSLNILNRGHSSKDYFSALETIEKYGQNRIKVAPHIILGIPGETKDDYIKSITSSINSPIVKGIKIHHLQIHKGTELEKVYKKQNFDLITKDQYIELLAEILTIIPDDIALFRLFTTTPESYLIAPKWGKTTQQLLIEFEAYLKLRNIRQGTRNERIN